MSVLWVDKKKMDGIWKFCSLCWLEKTIYKINIVYWLEKKLSRASKHKPWNNPSIDQLHTVQNLFEEIFYPENVHVCYT